MKNLLKKYKIQLQLLLILTIGLVVLSVIYYFFIPLILNYPAGTYGTKFQVELENASYFVQVIEIVLAIWVIFTISTLFQTHFLIKYEDLLNHPQKYTVKQINALRNKLFTTPYTLLISNIVIPSIALTVIHAYSIHHIGTTTLKLFMLVVSILTIYVIFVFICTCNIFKKILTNLPYTSTEGLKKSTLKKRIFFNILPAISVSILFTSLIGYSILSRETGDSIFQTYSNSLFYFKEFNTFENENDLFNKLNSLHLLSDYDYVFVRKADGSYVDINNQNITISNFFNKYLNEFSEKNNGRVYEYYGIDCQGATVHISINGEDYIVGVYFYVISDKVLLYFGISLIVLLSLNIFILNLFSNSLSNEINIISSSLLRMSKQKDNEILQPLTLTSNDEFGNLIISYNKIQDLTKNNIEQIRNSQDTLIEQERLASLGQMIGGIAHNLKTPIMSIAGAAEGLTDLVKEYDASIGNPVVTNDDFHDIAKDMNNWIDKIREYTEYMSDIITAVKGQAVSFSNDSEINFTVLELFKRVNILMKHELKNSIIYLNTHVDMDENTIINGDVNGLVQVINNMISNAIQAYNGKPEQSIELTAKSKGKKVIISIEDHAGGLPEKVKDKLFKEMITTKGKNGTGLGLYMSYSNIKAHFNGTIEYESITGQGTRFDIILPL